jgi:hypothetical protein
VWETRILSTLVEVQKELGKWRDLRAIIPLVLICLEYFEYELHTQSARTNTSPSKVRSPKLIERVTSKDCWS